MTRKILIPMGVIALAITITSTSIKTQPATQSPLRTTTQRLTATQSSTGAQPRRSSSHYSWHNSYKAVVDQTAAVVQGVVTSVTESYDEREGPRTHVTLSRLSTLWGEFKSPHVTLKLFGGPLPRRGRVDEVHIPTFVVGKRYLIFLSNREWRLSPVTAHQSFLIERVRNKDILVTTDGYTISGIDDASGPIRRTLVFRIPDQIPDNFELRIDRRLAARGVARASSPAEFVAQLREFAKRQGVSVSGTFNERPFSTGNWRVFKAAPDASTAGSPETQFEPRPGERKERDRERKPCWNRTTPTDADPKDRSPLCPEGGEK